MPINLQEIRTAVQTYLDTRVTVSISAITPATGSSIQPNENFSFSITVTNASAVAGGIALKNVRYCIWLDNYTVGKIIVPAAPMVARTGWLTSDPVLAAGTQVNGNMYLFPPNENNYLDPGESDTISLTGRAGAAAAAGGTTNIRFKIRAEADLAYLFPKHEDSPSTSRSLVVIG